MYGGRSIRAALGAALLVTAIWFTAEPASATTTETSFSFVSAPGDWIGQGTTQSFSEPTTPFAASGSFGWVEVTLWTGGLVWDVYLAPPVGGRLLPGRYPDAQRTSFRSPGHPGLDVSGQGHGCNQVFGEFTIKSIAFDATGDLTEFDATFIQRCESATAPPLTGVVKYKARPVAPVLLTVSHPSSVRTQPVVVSALVAPGSAGPPKGTVTFYDGPVRLGSAAVDPNGLAVATTTRLVVGSHSLKAVYSGDSTHGAASSDPVAHTVESRATAFWFESTSAEFVGAGITASYVPSTATIWLMGTNELVSFNVAGDDGKYWTAMIGPPTGQSFAAGRTYPTTRFADATHARLDVYGDGRGCNTTAGTLTINQIAHTGNKVVRLDATFIQYCTDPPPQPPMRGSITYNAGL